MIASPQIKFSLLAIAVLRQCTMTGTPGADLIDGTSGNGVICGMKGDDTINGQQGEIIRRY
jgi:hypothetical protein